MYQRNLLRIGKTALRMAPSARLMAVPISQRAFSVGAPQFKSALNAADSQLSKALKAEIAFEKAETTKANEEDALAFPEYAKKHGWEINVKEGVDTIKLVKQNGGEKIHVSFSVSSITYNDLDGEAFENELGETEEFAEDGKDSEAPLPLSVVIEKSSGKALAFEVMCQDRALLVESMTPFDSAELALSESAEAEAKRRAVYEGPSFLMLEEELQKSVDVYLESRGIDTVFAEAIYAYAVPQENAQYVHWLKRVKDIVEE